MKFAYKESEPFPLLLQRLEDILQMSRPLPHRLSFALQMIAHDIGAESAFLYRLSQDYYLEPFASCDPLAHDTYQARFRMGEGLVGFIGATGKSLLCENMSRHPNFLYAPGVAEQINLALVGVPLLSPRGNIGVLTFQNPSAKSFSRETEERLTAVGHFFAQLPELNSFSVLSARKGNLNEMHRLQGVGLNTGIAMGRAIIHHPRTWKEKAFSLHPQEENNRLTTAIREMIEEIDRLVASAPTLDKDMQDVLAAYRIIAADRGWIRKLNDFIQKGFTAEAAVQKVRRLTRERYAQMGDQLLKSRLSDLEDLASRLLKHLSGQDSLSHELSEASILIAQNLGPAELLDYDRRFIKGVLLEEGVHTAHVVIVARALDIPIVGRISSLLAHINEGDKLIIDGETGKIVVTPSAEELHFTREKLVQMKKLQALTEELRDISCQTKEGTRIKVTLNAGLPIDIYRLDKFQVEGVGLYRTEIPFMMRSSFPDSEAQAEVYRDVLAHAKDWPVTFRILDIGGDKVVPYLWHPTDDNPALGWRGVRVVLDKPTILRQQIRALLLAAEGREIRLLFPLVSDLSEYREARHIVESEQRRFAEKEGSLLSPLLYGVMLEVPAIVDQLDFLVKEVDFISVGTNDLFQFFYASDRGNPRVSNRYDSLSSSFLRYLRAISSVCEAADVPLNVCGEMAGKPLEALSLLAIGYRSLSVSGSAAGALKKAILDFPLEEASLFMKTALSSYSPTLREEFRAFLASHHLDL